MMRPLIACLGQTVGIDCHSDACDPGHWCNGYEASTIAEEIGAPLDGQTVTITRNQAGPHLSVVDEQAPVEYEPPNDRECYRCDQ